MSSCNKTDFNGLPVSCFIRVVKTCYPQACCKLFEQLAASLQITIYSKPDLGLKLMNFTSIKYAHIHNYYQVGINLRYKL
jgi:hypothetical protein